MYLFNHLPKCGGLSYRALLEELFGLANVEHISINLEEEYHPNPDDYLRFPMLMGHFGARWHDMIGPGRRWMTALREPVDRVVSTYYYYRHNAPLSPESPWLYMAQTMSLDRFLRCGHYLVLQGIKNAQTWQLADDLRWRYRAVPEQDALALAKETLDRCEFIGIYEEFDQSIERMCQYLGRSAPPKAPHVNATKKRPAVAELSPATLAAIQDLNRADIELYQYALQKVRHPEASAARGPTAECRRAKRLAAYRYALQTAPVPGEEARALRLHVLYTPFTCGSGEVLELIVKVANHGARIWSSAPPNPLLLSYHWLQHDGTIEVFDGWRSEIRPVLWPFSAERYRMHVLAPAKPGIYTLRVTLVQEWVAWFDQDPLGCWEDLRIRVEDTASARPSPAAGHSNSD